MTKKKVVSLAIFLILGGGALGVFWFNQKTPTQDLLTQAEFAPTITQAPTSAAENLTFIASENGQTALELLKAGQSVELTEYDFGSFITAINDLKANETYYWAFYVNGEYAQQAADKTVLNQGDKVEFRYEKIQTEFTTN